MNIWIIVAYNTNYYPRVQYIEIEAADVYAAFIASGFSQSDIISVKLKGL